MTTFKPGDLIVAVPPDPYDQYIFRYVKTADENRDYIRGISVYNPEMNDPFRSTDFKFILTRKYMRLANPEEIAAFVAKRLSWNSK